MTSTAGTNETSSSGFCVHCVTGFRIPGEPKGKIEKIHGIDTYVATPANPSSDSASKAIIYFFDSFGLKLENNKVIPGKIADATGLTVYVPDMFNGGGITEESISSAPSTAAELKSSSLFSKLKVGASFALSTPFFLRNLPQKKIAPLKKWIEALKSSHGYARLGGVGYCYGGKLVIALNATDHINVSVANHPSFITKGNIAALKNPVLFNCAEEDPVFNAQYARQVKEEWKGKEGKPEHKFNHYPNTVHGFAARPNLADKQVKEAFEKAFQEGVDWWKAHL
ncbi:hypothetical protein NDA16_000365 [Ustilago loliicola]|nr:hypothetical protein NDA16_000365 [Ustilago loliicola]